MSYKWCAVPKCKNTSIKTPNKIFFYVPKVREIRNKWLTVARRNPNDVATQSALYFCEDHFDLPNDMENYMQYHIMGSVSQIRTKPGCQPTKFFCQLDRQSRTSDSTTERPFIAKKRRKNIIKDCDKQFEGKEIVIEQPSIEKTASSSSDQWLAEEDPQLPPRALNKSIQVNIRKRFRSKATQTTINSVYQRIQMKHGHKMEGELSDGDTSDTASTTYSETTIPSSDWCEMLEDEKGRENVLDFLECTLKKIQKSPCFYIGIPSSCYCLVNLIQEQTNIPLKHILLCLKKIRLNNSFRELSDDFGIDKSHSSKIFLKNVPIIASVMRHFIIPLDEDLIKKNLPMAFRHKYDKVSCIINCLEIEILKPPKASNKALYWSEYRKTNTIKYLVSYTPNGLINYISNGYGGQVADTCIVETSDFSKSLQPNMCIMADRGFKHVEVYLRKMRVSLVRLRGGAKLTKDKAQETKQIASLRIRVEQVIRQLREFNMLKPHACLNLSLVKVLDDVITIACGLVNILNI